MSDTPKPRHSRGQVWAVFKKEAALLRGNPLLIIAAVLISLVPSIYTYIYVRAIWDPYGNIHQLPVGIVTLDQGTEFRGQHYNLGGDLMAQLLDSNRFCFTQFESSEEAVEAVRANAVYFALVVPRDFSAKALPGRESVPLHMYTSGGTSYTAMLIAQRFGGSVAEQLNDHMGTERWRVVLSSGNDARGGVVELSDGVRQLLDGVVELRAGLDTAHEGAGEIRSNQVRLMEGLRGIPVRRLSEGIGEIDDGAGELSSGLAQIDTGRLTSAENTIADGQQELASGLAEVDADRLVSAGQELHDNTAELAEGVAGSRAMRTLAGGAREDLERLAAGGREDQENIVRLGDGVRQMQAGSRRLAEGSQTFRERIGDLAAGVEQLQAGSRRLVDGTREYREGISDLGEGLRTAAEGASELASGSGRLVAGLERLRGGGGQLNDGLERVSDGLGLFLQRLPASGEEQNPEDLAASVGVQEHDLAPAGVNGPAFAPYFMALSMWLGSVVSAFLFHFNVLPRSVERKTRIAKIIGKGIIPGGITLTAAMLLGMTIHLLMGVPLDDAKGFYMVLLCAAVTFDTIVYALIRLLGDAGKMVSVIILVLQLASAGGPYPIQLSGPFYQTVHGWLPFTYAVKGLRAAMFGSYNGDWALQIAHMTPWILVGIVISFLTADRFHHVDDEEYRSALKVSW
jgi:putative membrane protein